MFWQYAHCGPSVNQERYNFILYIDRNVRRFLSKMQQKRWLKFRINIFYKLKDTGVFSYRLFYVEFNRGRRAIGVRPPVLKLRCAFHERILSTIPLLCSVLNCPRWKCSVLFWVISRMTTWLIAHPTITMKTSSIWGSFRRPWLLTFKVATLKSSVYRIKCARPEPFSLSILIQEMGGWRRGTSLIKAFPLWWLSPAWWLIIFCRKSWVHFSKSWTVILLWVSAFWSGLIAFCMILSKLSKSGFQSDLPVSMALT